MIYCIVPAAGESTRFPWNKLLYVYHSKPLIVQTLENITASKFVEKVILVTGHQRELVEKTVREHGIYVDVVYNPDYTAGMSSSIKTGLKYILSSLGNPRGIMVNPADVAWVHPGIYDLVSLRFLERCERYSIAIASYKGVRGHPVVFSNKLIEELLSISEEKQGLKEVIQRHRDEILVVETNYPGVLLDLDTLLDLLRVKSTLFI